jgi:hypothetical protein
MRTQALRIVSLAAILATLTGGLATGAFAEPVGGQTPPQGAASWTSSSRPLNSSDFTSTRAISYRSEALDTGPPTPGPTDPNGPSS